jgi:hypothetical protein
MFQVKIGQVWSDGIGNHYLIKKVHGKSDREDRYCQVDAYVVSGSYQGTTKYFWIEPDDELVCDTVDNHKNVG